MAFLIIWWMTGDYYMHQYASSHQCTHQMKVILSLPDQHHEGITCIPAKDVGEFMDALRQRHSPPRRPPQEQWQG